jgi:hypothetical protein
MERCKGCGRLLARKDPGRRQWCRDIRTLFVISDVLPEDYHRNCFLDALIDHRTESLVEPEAAHKPTAEPSLVTAESQPPGWW